MRAWRHTYPFPRDYGFPFGLVQPGAVIEATQPPEPAFFERVDDPKAAAPSEVRSDLGLEEEVSVAPVEKSETVDGAGDG